MKGRVEVPEVKVSIIEESKPSTRGIIGIYCYMWYRINLDSPR